MNLNDWIEKIIFNSLNQSAVKKVASWIESINLNYLPPQKKNQSVKSDVKKKKKSLGVVESLIYLPVQQYRTSACRGFDKRLLDV